ncbi:MAG: ester cyclase [Acidobacteriia bacterium]|nr:ester cyclase [Terriglobia bacterium]
MSEANKALVRRWFEEVWNQGREETIDELFATNAVGYGLGDTDVTTRGPAEFKIFANNLRGALPDIHMKIEDSIAEGDKVTVRLTVEGTHLGGHLGVAPTGRRIRIAGIVVVRIASGQIVEGWNSWDQLGLLRQIGALPAQKGPDSFTTARA